MSRLAPLLAGVLALAGGCLRSTSHRCETAEQCSASGQCEANGACSFPAAECPGGRRFGEDTGPLAGQCVGGESPDGGDPIDALIGPPDALDATQAAVDYGDQRNGDLVTMSGDARVNSYGTLNDDAPAGATVIRVNLRTQANVGAWNRDFVVGDVIMIVQTRGVADPLMTGVQTPLALTGAPGRYHLTRIVARVGLDLTIADPLPVAFERLDGQVIKVPQLGRVAIGANGHARPAPYDGVTGGVVAFYANELRLDSGATVDATSRGFRAGQVSETGNYFDCTELDGPSTTGGGARKGESLVAARYQSGNGSFGRGNVFSGGGGGNCHNAGGAGGGGPGGAGGGGGNDSDNRAAGGLPGVAVQLDPRTHLTFGGGGGAGEDNTAEGTNGADGGGVVFVQVRTITCVAGGALVADGDWAGDAGIDGAGGAGAGGLVWVRTESITGCEVRANGGGGGAAMNPYGPGGGAAGGRVVLIARTSAGVTYLVDGGPAGLSTGAGGTRGATAGGRGAMCGNGTREANESCDDGNYRPDDECVTCAE